MHDFRVGLEFDTTSKSLTPSLRSSSPPFWCDALSFAFHGPILSQISSLKQPCFGQKGQQKADARTRDHPIMSQ